MAASIEILDGNAAWPLAEPLDRECYPPEVMANIVWRDVVWAHAEKRVFVRTDGNIVCHVGLYFRRATSTGSPVLIGGIGGVMTSPRARRQGYAGSAMQAAAQVFADEDCDFGLLFCEAHNFGFYERLNCRLFEGEVSCMQPSGLIKFEMMCAMVLPLRTAPADGVIDLCGLPW
jgi:aminoglycoside 2'-N-acetyltransferase I